MSLDRSDPGIEVAVILRRFKLKVALELGGNATAYIVVYHNGSRVDTTKEFTVYDDIGVFEGAVGARGVARYWPDSKRWEILQMECPSSE